MAYLLVVILPIALAGARRSKVSQLLEADEEGIGGLTIAGAKIGYGIFNDIALSAEQQVNGPQKDGQTLHQLQVYDGGQAGPNTWDSFIDSWNIPYCSVPADRDGISFKALMNKIGVGPTFKTAVFFANGKNPFEAGRDTFGNWLNGKGGKEIGQVNIYGLDQDTATKLRHAHKPLSYANIKHLLLGSGLAPVFTKVVDTAISNPGMSNSLYVIVGKANLKHFADQGCYRLTREECCEYVDGREAFQGQDCVPAKDGAKYSWGPVCEPIRFAKHKENDSVGYCPKFES